MNDNLRKNKFDMQHGWQYVHIRNFEFNLQRRWIKCRRDNYFNLDEMDKADYRESRFVAIDDDFFDLEDIKKHIANTREFRFFQQWQREVGNVQGYMRSIEDQLPVKTSDCIKHYFLGTPNIADPREFITKLYGYEWFARMHYMSKGDIPGMSLDDRFYLDTGKYTPKWTSFEDYEILLNTGLKEFNFLPEDKRETIDRHIRTQKKLLTIYKQYKTAEDMFNKWQLRIERGLDGFCIALAAFIIVKLLWLIFS